MNGGVVLSHCFTLNLLIMNNIQNRVRLIGHLGADPEILQLDNDRKGAKFSMATNDHYKIAQGERIENTQWHQVVAWGKLAELCEQLLEKGKKVAIEGKLVHRSYEKKDGEKRYVSEVHCDELLLL